jgi:hypothetical protein
MSTWVIVSWVLVAILTAINIVVFLQLKKASDQMMKMAFPNAKNMQDAMKQMQSQMNSMRASRGRGGFQGGMGGSKHKDAQLRAAMEMLQNMNKKR